MTVDHLFLISFLQKNMKCIYARIRKRARQIVSRFPPPAFYKDYSYENELSRQYFETHPVTCRLKAFVEDHLEDDFGHGLDHAIKVAIDSGALMAIEIDLAEYAESPSERRIVIVQCAALLHDIKRKKKDHAIAGSSYARKILKAYPFETDEIEDISIAILNHEAFKRTVKANSIKGALVSDCLYDADKFRWGPDNFTDTVWDMVEYFNVPVSTFMGQYPKGLESLARIKNTFRTATGRKYGPQFIDAGLAIGEELFDYIQTEFSHLL